MQNSEFLERAYGQRARLDLTLEGLAACVKCTWH